MGASQVGYLLFITGCAQLVNPPRRPPPREIYSQVPLRNWIMTTTIAWNAQFTPGDPNAYSSMPGLMLHSISCNR